MSFSQSKIVGLVKELNELGAALSSEPDSVRLMELIVQKAMDLTNADGGTLYIKTPDDKLKFEILKNNSLGLHEGGTSQVAVLIPPISLFDPEGNPNRKLVSTCCVVDDQTINVADAYQTDTYDFSGTKGFDQRFGYHSRAFIAVPMKNHEHEVIGVLQLINKVNEETGETEAFSDLDKEILQSLASQAAVTMTKQALIDDQRKLFDCFIQLIARAIDQKSPYTGGHCRRVPVLTNMLAQATCRIQVGPLQSYDMTEAEMYELEVAGWLHDCGKITIPEFVVDKATKLETIYDRMVTVETRLEVLRRDAIIDALIQRLDPELKVSTLIQETSGLHQRLQLLEEYREFLNKCNVGGESMEEEDLRRIDEIARETWHHGSGIEAPLLSAEERKNLKISRGTLNPEEREIINSHMQITIDMLESLPYPKHLKRVPEYAGGHHEKMDGSGFPKGLTREQMSLPARMMAIADIFEALTACDRPYKKAMTLSQALKILGRMKLNNHIDPDLFDVFIHEKVYLEYAREHLSEEQIDLIEVEQIPGYQAVA